MSFSETLDETHGARRKTEALAPDHVEAGVQTKVEETGLLYDVHGMLLIPQPTDRSDDPLVHLTPEVRADRRHGGNITNCPCF
jgi:hypothetical protein